MITSFFKPKGDEAASSTDASASSSTVAASAPKRQKGEEKTVTPSEPTAAAKGRARRIIDDDEDENVGQEVTPMPAPVELSSSSAPAPDVSVPMSVDEPAPEETAAGSSSGSSKAAATQPAAASKASAKAAAPKAAAKTAVAPKPTKDDDDDEEEAAEEGAAAGSSAKPLKLKQASSKGKGAKGTKPKGATANSVAYHKYDVLGAATWKPGQPVPYLFLARVFGKIETESKRLLITEMMANAFRTVIATSPQDVLPMMAVSTNKLAPAYEGVELGIGDAIMMKAVAETCGRSIDAIKSDLEVEGDLGVVAMASRGGQKTLMKPKPLGVQGVLKTLKEIATISGDKAMARKKDKIKNMLVASQEKEAQYIVRSLQGKMRIGLAEQTALVALAHAFVLQSPPAADGSPQEAPVLKGEALDARLAKAEEIIKQCFSEMPNYEVIIPALLAHGIDELPKHAALTAGVPVKPMLAKPTKGIGEVLDRFSNCSFTCEYKYDGERAQIHLMSDGSVRVFSRNSEDNTSKYPDIAQLMPRAKKDCTTSAILDAEAVAMDMKTGAILPFQVLSTRKRKEADINDIAVKVCVFAFDLIYLNGESYLQKPLIERRAALRASFEVLPREFEFAIASDASDAEEIQTFLEESIKGNCEGLMVKTLDVDATYEPSRRSLNWLKVKKDYLAGMTDSCDLVPIGAYYGKGKRTGVYGAYLLACYNPDEECYESVCKIGTGFNDEALASLHATLSAKTIDAPRAYYRVPEWADNQMPDVWFEACQVWEVLAADLSISPVHIAAAGLVDPSKGIALRFPRFIRLRDDKGCEDATNSEQIAEMYNNQACTKSNPANDDDE